jgi:MerR family glutamine synthetase transcriptional repressor
MPDRSMGIGAVSRRTGLSERQIRYYEQLGMISPRRTAGGQRYYGEAEVARLLEIRRILATGQTLATARRVVEAQQPGEPESDVRSRLMARSALRSLYPVSNRAELERVLSEHHAQEEEDGVD